MHSWLDEEYGSCDLRRFVPPSTKHWRPFDRAQLLWGSLHSPVDQPGHKRRVRSATTWKFITAVQRCPRWLAPLPAHSPSEVFGKSCRRVRFISSDTSTNLRRNQLCAFVLFFVSSPRNCGRAMTLIFRTLLAVLLVGVGEFGIACSAGIRGALESAPVRDLHFLKLEFKFEG